MTHRHVAGTRTTPARYTERLRGSQYVPPPSLPTRLPRRPPLLTFPSSVPSTAMDRRRLEESIAGKERSRAPKGTPLRNPRVPAASDPSPMSPKDARSVAPWAAAGADRGPARPESTAKETSERFTPENMNIGELYPFQLSRPVRPVCEPGVGPAHVSDAHARVCLWRPCSATGAAASPRGAPHHGPDGRPAGPGPDPDPHDWKQTQVLRCRSSDSLWQPQRFAPQTHIGPSLAWSRSAPRNAGAVRTSPSDQACLAHRCRLWSRRPARSSVWTTSFRCACRLWPPSAWST